LKKVLLLLSLGGGVEETGKREKSEEGRNDEDEKGKRERRSRRFFSSPLSRARSNRISRTSFFFSFLSIFILEAAGEGERQPSLLLPRPEHRSPKDERPRGRRRAEALGQATAETPGNPPGAAGIAPRRRGRPIIISSSSSIAVVRSLLARQAVVPGPAPAAAGEAVSRPARGFRGGGGQGRGRLGAAAGGDDDDDSGDGG
jgi:hypothetical protein